MAKTTPAENKRIMRKFVEQFWNKRKLEWADQALAPNFIRREIGSGDEYRGPAGLKAAATKWAGAFPNMHLVIDEIIAEGNCVATRWTSRGSHKGVLEGLAPTGKKIVVRGISTVRFANGRMIEELVAFDTLPMMQQLGVIPK